MDRLWTVVFLLLLVTTGVGYCVADDLLARREAAAIATEMQVILSSETASKQSLALANGFDVTPEGRVLLGLEGNLYDIAGRDRLLAENDPELSGFAFADREVLFVIRGQSLGYYDGAGITGKINLPTAGMQIVRGGRNRMLLFGGKRRPNCSVYAFYKGARYKQLVDLPEPVTAVAEGVDELYCSAGHELYALRGDGTLDIAVILPDDDKIYSLAFDEKRLVLYIIAGRKLYSFAETRLQKLADSIGDHVRVRGDQLYVLDCLYRKLVRFDLPLRRWTKR